MRDKEVKAELNVAIASYDILEIRVLKRYLEEQSASIKCSGYQNGAQLLAALRCGEHYDIIVMGSKLEDMDDGELVVRLKALEQCERRLLLPLGEGCRSADAVSCLRADGKSYITKRTDLQNLMRAICSLSGRQALRTESLCSVLYSDWGISRTDTNCAYLTSALRIACGSNEKLAIRKELLRQVSVEHHTSVVAVDSGIRRLIDTLERQQAEGWCAFKRKCGFADKKPTTGRLIYAAKEYLLTHGAA